MKLREAVCLCMCVHTWSCVANVAHGVGRRCQEAVTEGPRCRLTWSVDQE